MVILDLSIVNVALPSIQASLGFSSIDLQWVVDAYAVIFAGFLMLAGRATDQFGQRRTLVAALLIFALASLAGGTAPDQTLLIVARGVQGFGGALMAAGSLAAITSSFAEGAARHRAIGLWGAMNGAGGAAGVFFGGVITQDLGWRWILLVNTPIATATAIGAYIVVADQRNAKRATRFDFGGALALTGGLLALVYGIVTAGYLGLGSRQGAHSDRHRGRAARAGPADRVPLRLGAARAARDRSRSTSGEQTESCSCSVPRCSPCGT